MERKEGKKEIVELKRAFDASKKVTQRKEKNSVKVGVKKKIWVTELPQ
jgi:hypothetical protein